MIVTCGKTINFLKLNTVTSELVSYSSSVVTDPIDLIMSPEQVQISFLLWNLDILKKLCTFNYGENKEVSQNKTFF